MKIAIAQIDMRLGDIEGICGRIEDQARLAHERGSRMLCVPAPLFSGPLPGSLVSAGDYEHDVLQGLSDLAQRIQELGVICLVPAAVCFREQPLFEFFMLKDGRAVPARTTIALQRGEHNDLRWAPPVFDVDGVRVAVLFDLERDLDVLPSGVDLIVYFQIDAFDMTRRESCAVAAIRSGAYRNVATKRSVWFACVSPVGAYDESIYTGGSFVLDDCGHVVAMAPCFEESLLVQDVQRGMTLEHIEDHELPEFHAEQWLWHALVLDVRDAARAQGTTRAVVALEGDLPSSLLTALAVDALGPRNVIGLVVGREGVFTPRQEAAELRRSEAVRALAEHLHMRTVERDAPSASCLVDRVVSGRDSERLRDRALGLLLEDTTSEMQALALSPLCKTDYALCAPALSGGYQGELAPFGDVYLTSLEFVARVRNRASAVVPQELVTLNAVEDSMNRIVARSLRGLKGPTDIVDRAAQLLGALEPGEIDGALEAHVDRNVDFDDVPLAKGKPEACSLLLMLVRTGETARRVLPSAPIVSARSFMERAWPQMLAWSDMGHAGKDTLSVEALVKAELARFDDEGSLERMRGELAGMLGDLLGITPEQMEELRSDEGQRRMRENMQKFEGQVRDAIEHMMGGAAAADTSGGDAPRGPQMPQGFQGPQSFFSDN